VLLFGGSRSYGGFFSGLGVASVNLHLGSFGLLRCATFGRLRDGLDGSHGGLVDLHAVFVLFFDNTVGRNLLCRLLRQLRARRVNHDRLIRSVDRLLLHFVVKGTGVTN